MPINDNPARFDLIGFLVLKYLIMENKIKWIELSKENLPNSNELVLVKRTQNKLDNMPIYIAKRNNIDISTNPDASQNCAWYGRNVLNPALNDRETFLDCQFSDVTVLSWAPLSEILKII